MPVLPIVLYNDPVLREKSASIETDSKSLQLLIDDMYETMYNANGVGLAAPQIGKNIRLFVVDADVMVENSNEPTYGPMEFINPEIIESGDELVEFEEGCLSLPDLREKVTRPDRIVVRYMDRNFNQHQQEFEGWMSRVFQHELDHLDGVLFFDHLGSFKKRLLQRKLALIEEGLVEADYQVRVHNKTI